MTSREAIASKNFIIFVEPFILYLVQKLFRIKRLADKKFPYFIMEIYSLEDFTNFCDMPDDITCSNELGTRISLTFTVFLAFFLN